jgi:hypothetical protein
MGALYLASKLEECPLRMRDLINIYDLLLQRSAHASSSPTSASPSKPPSEFKYVAMSYFGSTFYDLKDALVVAEMQILKRLGFNVHVVLPYGTLVNYLRVLDLTGREDVCTRAWGYLNDAFVQIESLPAESSSKLTRHSSLQTAVYALYPVPTIVSAAILLATRYLDVALPDKWWELFDANWEDLWSVCGWIMRLYRVRSRDDIERVEGMMSKKEVRRWLEENVE